MYYATIHTYINRVEKHAYSAVRTGSCLADEKV